MGPLTFWDHLIAFLLAVVIPLTGALQHRRIRGEGAYETRQKIALYWSSVVQMAILAGAVVWAGHHAGRTPADLGLTVPPERPDLGLLLASIFLAAYAVDAGWQLATPERRAATRARWRRDTPFMPATARELRHSLALVVSAAIGEEILYRGFLISYLTCFTGTSRTGLVLAVAVPAVVFAVSHLYQGTRAVAKIVVLACLFGAIFVVTGSLWIVIALHFVVDLVGVLLGPKLLAARKQFIVHVALVVRDYDEAIEFYTRKLRFTLVEDTYQPEQDKRWVVVAPPGSAGTSLVLAKASTREQAPFVGRQTGGRVFLFLSTDDFWRDYNEMVANGIRFVREPKVAPYGTVAVFEDLYGNLWDLLELNQA